MKAKFNSFGKETSKRRNRLMGGLVAVLTMTLALSACAKDDIISHLDSDLPKPVEQFLGTDDEVLAKAQEVFLGYLATFDDIANNGGKNPERLSEFSSGKKYEEGVEAIKEYAESGNKSVGFTTAYNPHLQSIRYIDGKEANVVIYNCFDFSGREVFDSGGEKIHQPIQAITFRHTFKVVILDGVEDWKLIESEPWLENSLC